MTFFGACGILNWNCKEAASEKGDEINDRDCGIRRLAIDERLTIFKNRIQPEKMTGNEKRICIVTGIHGDELEGQYVCYELNRILREQKERVKGIVDIYPAMNPLGVDSITRGVPGFDIDMNRIFPGSEEGR